MTIELRPSEWKTGEWKTGVRSHEFGRLRAIFGLDERGIMRVTGVLDDVLGARVDMGNLYGDVLEIFPEMRDVVRRVGAGPLPHEYEKKARMLHYRCVSAGNDPYGLCRDDWERAYLKHCIPLNSNDRYQLRMSLGMKWQGCSDEFIRGRADALRVDHAIVIRSFPHVTALTNGQRPEGPERGRS